jgi:hypothetical protein
MRKVLRWNLLAFAGAGAISEIIVFFASIPPGSTTAPTPLESALGYSQLPGTVLFGLFAAAFGHSLDELPHLTSELIIWIAVIAAYLIQSAFFGALLWFSVRAGSGLRRAIHA